MSPVGGPGFGDGVIEHKLEEPLHDGACACSVRIYTTSKSESIDRKKNLLRNPSTSSALEDPYDNSAPGLKKLDLLSARL